MINVDLAAAAQLAALALPHYGLDPATPLTLLKYRENFVFSAHSDGVDFVVRVHRRGYHSDVELASEVEFVHALHAQGVAVPQFIRTHDERTFCVVGETSPYGAHQVDLQLLLANHGSFGAEATAFAGTAQLPPSDFAELGTLLARVHDATERSGYTMSVPRQDWDLAGLTGPSWAWGDPLRLPELAGQDLETVEAAIAQMRKTLAAYGAHPMRYGPIHADLTPENVLRTHNGLVLIDFDDFAQGWHLFDLATALNFFLPHPRYEEYRVALFGAYEAVRPFEERDHAAYPAITLARALTYLGWAADRRGDDTAEFVASDFIACVVDLAHELLAAQPDTHPAPQRLERTRK
jgi:Ser/Thr protein kinase RdoA (MazF antagonist)